MSMTKITAPAKGKKRGMGSDKALRTGEFIRKWFLDTDNAPIHVQRLYNIFKIEKERRGLKPPAPGSFRVYIQLLKNLGLIEVVGHEPSVEGLKKPRTLYRANPVALRDPDYDKYWKDPQKWNYIMKSGISEEEYHALKRGVKK